MELIDQLSKPAMNVDIDLRIRNRMNEVEQDM